MELVSTEERFGVGISSIRGGDNSIWLSSVSGDMLLLGSSMAGGSGVSPIELTVGLRVPVLRLESERGSLVDVIPSGGLETIGSSLDTVVLTGSTGSVRRPLLGRMTLVATSVDTDVDGRTMHCCVIEDEATSVEELPVTGFPFKGVESSLTC